MSSLMRGMVMGMTTSAVLVVCGNVTVMRSSTKSWSPFSSTEITYHYTLLNVIILLQ